MLISKNVQSKIQEAVRLEYRVETLVACFSSGTPAVRIIHQMQDELPTVFVEPIAPKQQSAFSRLIPQISLLQLMLIVVIVALLAAYYAKTESTAREIERLNASQRNQIHELKLKHEHIQEIQSSEIKIFQQISGLPHLSYHCLFVDSGYYFSRNNPYRIYAYLDPSKNTLLKVAYQDIPLQDFPEAHETYLIPALGKNNGSRNIIRFDVFFNGEYFDYESILPFKGNIQVLPYNYSYTISEDNKISSANNTIKRNFACVNLTFDKPKRQLGWFEFLLSNGREFEKLLSSTPAQILRFRTDPESTEPCPGILLWLEVAPNDTNIEGIKPLVEPQ
jgi:hypothetical protein